ncbi:MAG: hypothetical protein F4X02_06065 [Chloroflexi bacterium]|nr:hypothetical protein [Chloroflexota bacterium]
MTATLRLAPVGRDKTEQAIALLRHATDARAGELPKIWVLLATRRQELSFRQRLIDAENSRSVYFNIEFFNFYSLNARLLMLAGTPARRLDRLTRHNLLRQLLAEMLARGQLRYFHRIAETRGFVSVAADLIDELKQSRVDVDDFAQAAHSEKDHEIAAIYRRYQDRLRQSELADVEGEGWLALAKLKERNDIVADVDLLLVDGYDQFTPVQAQLLAEIARAGRPLHITLTALDGDDSGLAPRRSSLARQRLERAFAAAGVELNQHLVAAVGDTRHPDLQQLSAGIFRHPPALPSGGAIKLIALPDPAAEVKAVLRAIKRLLLDGARADDILVALRDWGRYATYFESGRDQYRLPLLLHDEGALRRAPVTAALIDLLGLAPRFRRRDLLDILRSPYIDSGLSPEQIDLLERVSLDQQFPGGGPADWLEIIRLAQRRGDDARDDDEWTALSAEQAEDLAYRLSTFMDAVSAPPKAPLPDYVHWLAGLLGGDPQSDTEAASGAYSLNIIMRAWDHEQEYPAIVQRDINALNSLNAILRDLLASDAVLRATFQQDEPVEWERFRADLIHAVGTQTDQRAGLSRAGKVLVTTASEARGLPHDHVFIPGLAEGVFPAEASEDPLYLDSEREQLQARGIPLETRAERIDDRGLFYELISLPRQSLTLSRPTFQAGRVWIESHLWRAVNGVFVDLPLETRAVGAVIDPAESANSAELMLALADQLNSQDAGDSESALRARNWLLAQSSQAQSWRRLKRQRYIERRRLSNAAFDRFSGLLSHPALLAETSRLLGEGRVWSASRLKDYGLCGFRYFAKRLLRLEELEEPEAGVDALQLGLLNHSILERTYKRIAARGLAISEENRAEALRIFDEAAARTLRSAPADFNFRATVAWPQEQQILLAQLKALVEKDFSAESPLNRFGEARRVFELERYFSEVAIDLTEGMAPLRVNGFIDRIDLVDERLVVVDYKSGSTKINRDEMEAGRDFQMLVYTEALPKALAAAGGKAQVAGGLFWHLRGLNASGVLEVDNADDIAALEAAKAHIALNLRQGRAGQFPAHASKLENGKCARYCEFSRLCRRQVSGRHKPLPPPHTPSEDA